MKLYGSITSVEMADLLEAAKIAYDKAKEASEEASIVIMGINKLCDQGGKPSENILRKADEIHDTLRDLTIEAYTRITMSIAMLEIGLNQPPTKTSPEECAQAFKNLLGRMNERFGRTMLNGFIIKQNLNREEQA